MALQKNMVRWTIFTKNASKDELEEFSKLTKAVEVENTQRYVKAFDSYLVQLKKDFDFSQENLSLAISEGFLKEVESVKNGRSCMSLCSDLEITTYVQTFNAAINAGLDVEAADHAGEIAGNYTYAGCLYGCAIEQ